MRCFINQFSALIFFSSAHEVSSRRSHNLTSTCFDEMILQDCGLHVGPCGCAEHIVSGNKHAGEQFRWNSTNKAMWLWPGKYGCSFSLWTTITWYFVHSRWKLKWRGHLKRAPAVEKAAGAPFGRCGGCNSSAEKSHRTYFIKAVTALWAVSSLGDYCVMLIDNTRLQNGQKQMITLCYYYNNYDYLLPYVRWFPEPATTASHGERKLWQARWGSAPFTFYR